jgi:hypothetical protein
MTIRRHRRNSSDGPAGEPTDPVHAGAHSRRVRLSVVAGVIATVGVVGGGVALASTSAGASNGSGRPGLAATHSGASGQAGPHSGHTGDPHTGLPGRPKLPTGSSGRALPKPSTSNHPSPPKFKPVPMLAGTVKSTASSVILILDRQGFTRTVKVSSATSYKNGLTAAPAVGTKIVAIGKVDADGTSLDAVVVSKFSPHGIGHGPGRFGPVKPPTSTPKPAPTS